MKLGAPRTWREFDSSRRRLATRRKKVGKPPLIFFVPRDQHTVSQRFTPPPSLRCKTPLQQQQRRIVYARAHALSCLAVTLVDRALDARRTGEPYDLHLIKLTKGDQLKPDYLAVNPMGKVPALKHGDVVVTEAAAICTYLADAFPQAQLNIADRRPAPGRLSQMAVLRPELHRARDHRPRLSAGRAAAARHARLWRFQHRDGRGGEGRGKGLYLMGEQFTAADVVIGSGLRWGMMFNLLRSARSSSITWRASNSARRFSVQRPSISSSPPHEAPQDRQSFSLIRRGVVTDP